MRVQKLPYRVQTITLSGGEDHNVKIKHGENQAQKSDIKVDQVCKSFP